MGKTIKKFLLLAFICCSYFAKAQTTCDSAVLLAPSAICNYYYQTVPTGTMEMWYKFVADSSDVRVSTMQYGVPIIQQGIIELYSYIGDCDSLTQLGQQQQTLNIMGLTYGATYYVRVYQYNMTDFSICIQELGNSSCTGAILAQQTSTCNPVMYYIESGNIWIKFVATDTLANIVLSPTPDSVNAIINSINLFGGVCSNLNLMQTYSPNSPNDTIIAHNLVIGNTYYLQFAKYTKPPGYFDLCIIKNILLVPPPVIDFTIQPDSVVCVGDLVCFQESINIYTPPSVVDTFFWNFGGFAPNFMILGNDPTFADPICYTATVPGVYNISLSWQGLWDSLGVWVHGYQTATHILTVLAPPTTSFTFTPASPSCSNYICFVDSSTYVSGPDGQWGPWHLNWDFGDGGTDHTSPGDSICYTYSVPGTYIVTLIADNICGADTATDTIIILEPQAFFENDSVCIDNPIHFIDQSICPDFWQWDYGDGTTETYTTPTNPTYIYASSGTYSVTLTINNAGLPGSSYTHNVTVYPLPDPPLLTGHFNTCVPLETYTISNYQSNSVYSWGLDPGSMVVLAPGVSAFTINWSTLPNGGLIYLSVTDNHGCVKDTSYMVYECCTISGAVNYNYGPSITSSITLLDRDITINGTLEITGALTTVNWQGCHVYFGGDAKVIVHNGSKLYISPTQRISILRACGDYMWDGIFVTDGSSYLEIRGNTLTEEAKNAVVLKNGGKFKSLNSFYEDNYKDIVVNSYVGSNYPSNFEMTGNTLFCDHTLIPAWPPILANRTAYGVEVIHNKNLEIGKQGGASLKNTFRNMDVGINTLNSNVKVYNNLFENIQVPNPAMIGQHYAAIYSTVNHGLLFVPGITVGGSAAKANTFRNCTNGVYSYDNRTVSIIQNTFNYSNNLYKRGTAINLGEFIHYNNSKVVELNTINNYRNGIMMINVIKASIIQNTITNIVPPSSNPWANVRSYGIRVTGSTNITATTNTVQNISNTDWRIEGINFDLSPSAKIICNDVLNVGKGIFCGGTMPSNVLANDMTDCRDGFFLNWGTVGTQGAINHPQDNQWFGTFNCQTNSYNSDGINSPFFARQNPSSYWPTINCVDASGYPPATAIPFYSASGIPYLCAMIINPLPANLLQQQQIAQGLMNFPAYNNENKWMGKQGLYRHLLWNDTTNTDPILQQFKTQSNNGNLGKFETVNHYLMLNDSVNAMQYNNSISPVDLPETAAKTINTIYLNPVNHFGKQFKICDNDKLTLQDIASQCPYQYGNAVYQARLLLSFVDTTEYFNVCEFPDNGNNQKIIHHDNIEETSKILVYPNPANDELTVIKTSEGAGIIEIYNYLGEKIISSELKNYSSIISIKDLNAGVYLYKIIVNNSVVKADKLIVIK